MTATPPPADPNLPPQQPQYQQAPPVQPAGPLTVEQDISYSGWAYITASLGWAAFIGPLIIWLLFKQRGPRVNNEGKEALNFGILVSAATIVVNIVFGSIGAATLFTYQNVGYGISIPTGGGIGWIFLLLNWLIIVGIFVVALIWGLKGRQVVAQGGSYRYPVNVRLIK